MFAALGRLIDLDNTPATNQRLLLGEYNPFTKGSHSTVLKEAAVKFHSSQECAAEVKLANTHLATRHARRIKTEEKAKVVAAV